LGEMEARVGDDVVDLGPRQRRLVLAALALDANRLVSLEKLIDLLWPVSPTRTAAHAVQVCVSKLRSLLTGSGAELVTKGSAYLLRIEPTHVDAHLFQALAKQARTATDDNEVVTLLDQALALWRGPALADVADAEDRDRLCGGLAEMRLVAVEDRLDALLRLGRHPDVVGELTEWVATHPARERFVGQLMLALYRGGQASKALEVGRRHREYLAGQLGLDPGEDLRQLELAILRNDPALKPSTARTRPARPGNDAYAAERAHAHDAENDRRAADHHPHTAEAGPAGTLPADTGAFTGRAREIEQITAATSGGQVLVIHAIAGMPGIGKTALAVHVAHQLGERFPDGRIFVDLHGHTVGRSPADPGDVLARLLAADGVDPRQLPTGTEARSALWRARLAGRRVLIVLDNAVDSTQVSPLLPASTGCLVLVTSRRFLGDLPTDAVPVSLDVLTAAEAEQMFLRLAPQAGAYREQVADLMAACGFLPLAIALLARVLSRHRGWTVANLLTETRTRLLDITAEHASIRAAFELSYQHLPAARRRFFRQLPLHPGTEIEPHAAAALAGVQLSEATSQLDALHTDSLLTEIGYHRYTMHDLIRTYANTLTTYDTPATNRLLDVYQHATSAANARLSRLTRSTASSRPSAGDSDLPCPAGPAQALSWLRSERANLLACLANTNDPHRIVTLTAGLSELLRRDGPWTDALTLHTRAVQAAADVGDELEHANALNDLATVRRLSGDYPGAAKDMRLALEIHQALGNRLGEANARTGLGKALSRIADYPAAAAVVQPALDLYRDLDDLPGTAGALVELAIARAMTSNFHGAQEVLRQALILYRQLDDRPGQAYALRILGIAHGRAGDFTQARELLQQTLDLYRELGARLGQALTLTDLGWATTGAGDYPEATRILRTALHLNREINHRIGQSSALKHLGGALRRAGDLTAATATLHEALTLYQDIGNRSGEAMVLNELGAVHRLTGHVDRAVTAHQDALDLATQIPSPWDQAQSLAGFARCALARDQRHEGTTRLRQARCCWRSRPWRSTRSA
jgi:DNA-binding SARP family transcriptional activator/tetratricopeptide (TPR) repeat protein